MAIYEKNGQMTYVDERGDEHLLFPKTNIKRVVGLEEALASKAPAGYGLGETTSTTIQDCNEAIRNGWYVTGSVSETLNQPVHGSNPLPKGMLLVRARGAKIHQSYFACVSGVYATLERYSIDSGATWTEWEWVNPPMLPNEEYRTTKRHNGKPVYTKLIKHTFTATTGNVNGVTTFAINGGCSVVADIVSLSAVFVGYNGDKYIVPTMGGNGNVWLGVNRVASGNLYTIFVIVNDVFSTGSHGEVIYEYTKTTD